MKSRVNVRVEIDSSCLEPEVVIRAGERTALVERIVSAVEACAGRESPPVTAYRGDAMRLIEQRDIIRVHTEPRKLIVCAGAGEFEARCTLQEMEEALDPERFVRISRFELVNIEKIVSFDFSVTGTIKVSFEDGSSTWVARRYVHAIEQRLTSH